MLALSHLIYYVIYLLLFIYLFIQLIYYPFLLCYLLYD